MSLEAYAVVGVFGTVAALLFAWAGYSLLKAVRIAASDPVSVGEAAAGRGTGEFVGIAEAAEESGTFDAPFSGARALLSTYRVTQKSGSSGSWLTKASGALEQPFLVTDGGDRVLVDPAGATISPANESVRERTGDALPNEVRLRLSNHRSELDLEEILARNATRSRRYAEGYIAPGDHVHVYGGELEDTDAPGVDAKVVAGDGLYRITGGGESEAAWEFVKNAAVVGFVGLIASGGMVTELMAVL